MSRVEFWKEAADEFLDAVRWYEERSAGLGREFLRSLDICLSNIRRYPKLYPEIYRTARRALLRKFPYALYYVIQEETIIVIAILHTSRHPKLLRKRMR
ncbi:MAG: type II toxin-antitoxin system RelE/ParE family toxin [Ignavibacteriae bacterium]|nr:type II toxin-antitoxin system RelE/ParE family toxin [Ignavibacteriota bacterium]